MLAILYAGMNDTPIKKSFNWCDVNKFSKALRNIKYPRILSNTRNTIILTMKIKEKKITKNINDRQMFDFCVFEGVLVVWKIISNKRFKGLIFWIIENNSVFTTPIRYARMMRIYLSQNYRPCKNYLLIARENFKMKEITK